MDFNEKRLLGKTGLQVGRLGISSSYGAPAAAFEEAFERGCNYFTWGTFIKGRSSEMRKAIRNLVKKGKREELKIAVFSYAHNSFLTERSIKKGIRDLGIDYIDVLLLGWIPRVPRQSITEGALRLKEKGIVRFLGLSSHNRRLFPKIQEKDIFDLFHLRYNAVHRGAEVDIFPFLPELDRAGIVSFTATSWGKLLTSRKILSNEIKPTAADCYRFVLSNPNVDVCMMGAKNGDQMRENLSMLDKGPLSSEEMERMIRIGDQIYRH